MKPTKRSASVVSFGADWSRAAVHGGLMPAPSVAALHGVALSTVTRAWHRCELEGGKIAGRLVIAAHAAYAWKPRRPGRPPKPATGKHGRKK